MVRAEGAKLGRSAAPQPGPRFVAVPGALEVSGLGFYRVLLGFVGFYRVLWGFIGFLGFGVLGFRALPGLPQRPSNGALRVLNSGDLVIEGILEGGWRV